MKMENRHLIELRGEASPLHSVHGFQAKRDTIRSAKEAKRGYTEQATSTLVVQRATCMLWRDRRDADGNGKASCPEMTDALLSMIFSSPPSSSSSSSSLGFQRSRAAKLGSLARSTARSASIRAVESSFCFCSVASRCARTRASSGRYSLCARSGKSDDK